MECRKTFDGMGASRADEKSQRAYLGKLAADFEKVVSYSLNAYYTEDPIFNERLEMRLITRVIELNEVFSRIFSQRGHTRYFDRSRQEDKKDDKKSPDELPRVGFELPLEHYLELGDIVRAERFEYEKPSDDSIMEHIEDVFKKSRGPELGTVSLRKTLDIDSH